MREILAVDFKGVMNYNKLVRNIQTNLAHTQVIPSEYFKKLPL